MSDWHNTDVSYDGLQKLKKKNLVDGLDVDENSPQPDCIPCVEAKMTKEPYKSTLQRQKVVGALTHTDVCGECTT
jgi:hypothetical protein